LDDADLHTVMQQCEDYLFPKLQMTIRERSLYYHFFRHTHLAGRDQHLFAIYPLAAELQIAHSSVRNSIREMARKGCIGIERSRQGHIISVVLPSEIEGVLPGEEIVKDVDIEKLDFYSDRRFVAALLQREGGKCFYCYRVVSSDNCELDHLVPRAVDEDNSYRNIVVSCHDCNSVKAGKPAEDFLRSLYRGGVISQGELQERVEALGLLRAGELKPDIKQFI